MSERPNCLQRDACQAKTPGRHCKRCTFLRNAADPEFQAKRMAKLRVKMATTEYRSAHSEAQVRSLASRMQDPAFVEVLRENGRRYGAPNLGLANDPEARARAHVAIRAAHLAWCPPEHWSLNAELKRNAIPLEERKRIIGEMIEGSPEHGALAVVNARAAMQLKHERELEQRY